MLAPFIDGSFIGAKDAHPAGHAQMDQQGGALVQMDHNIFGNPLQPLNPAAFQVTFQLIGHGKTQIGTTFDHAGQFCPFHMGGKAAFDSFNFGQFRHGFWLAVGYDRMSLDAAEHSRSARAALWSCSMTDQQTQMPDDNQGNGATPAAEETVPFGKRDVLRTEKPRLVQGVFRSVADRYDLMNDLLSLGVHRMWKDAMISWLNPRRGMRVVDVAGGTGDIAFKIQERVRDRAFVTVIDLTESMVQVGRQRAFDFGFDENTSFVTGDALNLPVPSGTMDAYTIAFGIRNVTDIPQALAEAYRVLRPGGRFLCLEFSQVTQPALNLIYTQWSDRVMPVIGDRVANDRESYEYLVDSIRRFPKQDDFAAMIDEAGFSRVSYRNLTGGIAAIHSGWKI